MRILATGLIAFIVGLSSPMAKAAGTLQESQLRDAISDCRLLPTAVARLDCYDAIALPAAAATGEAVAADISADENASVGDTASGSEEAEFGFEFDVKDALQSVTSEITRVRKNAKGGLVLTLANDQVWQQSDGQTLFLDEGDNVTIARGALSAFYLTKDGKGRRYKFARVQ